MIYKNPWDILRTHKTHILHLSKFILIYIFPLINISILLIYNKILVYLQDSQRNISLLIVLLDLNNTNLYKFDMKK